MVSSSKDHRLSESERRGEDERRRRGAAGVKRRMVVESGHSRPVGCSVQRWMERASGKVGWQSKVWVVECLVGTKKRRRSGGDVEFRRRLKID